MYPHATYSPFRSPGTLWLKVCAFRHHACTRRTIEGSPHDLIRRRIAELNRRHESVLLCSLLSCFDVPTLSLTYVFVRSPLTLGRTNVIGRLPSPCPRLPSHGCRKFCLFPLCGGAPASELPVTQLEFREFAAVMMERFRDVEANLPVSGASGGKETKKKG